MSARPTQITDRTGDTEACERASVCSTSRTLFGNDRRRKHKGGEPRGLIPRARNPRARGLALGYTLSPASTRAYSSFARNPRARGLALGYTLSPASTRAYPCT